MSFFGKNIKKIRSVKGLSQQAFADLFGLKRGTLGAYEEGRSEPRIDTIIKIANYFSIQIDNLLTNDITVNELLKFKGDLTAYSEEAKKELFARIPCITDNSYAEYISHFQNENYIKELPYIQLPINPTKNFRALTITGLEMTNQDRGFYPKDIVIGEKVPSTVIKKLNNGTLVFALVNNSIIFRRLYITKNEFIFRADHKNIDDEVFNLSEIKELWRVRYIFCKRIPVFSNSFEDKLLSMEQEIIKMKAKLG